MKVFIPKITLLETHIMECARKIRLCAYKVVPSPKTAYSEVNMILNALTKRKQNQKWHATPRSIQESLKQE